MKLKNAVIYGIFGFLDFGVHFLIFYGVPEAREVSRNLPGARGFVVIEYGPVASRGDPIRVQNDRYTMFLASQACAVLSLRDQNVLV